MIINAEALDGLFKGFNTSFNKGFEGAESQWAQLAMLAPSGTREQTYAWLGQTPAMREWIGDRVIKSLAAYGYTVRNKDWEMSVEVDRNDIEDDQFGVYGPMIADMGRAAADFPDQLLFALLNSGFVSPCYDGQNFFDTDHNGFDASGAPVLVANMQAGAGPTWYLFDTTRAVKPLIYQERRKPQLTRLDQPTAENVFMRKAYLYGADQRGNAGFGLWQLAYASQAPLTAANYKAARQAIMVVRGDEGRLLGLRPNKLVVPPSLEEEARILINSATIAASSNPWVGSADLLMSPWLAT